MKRRGWSAAAVVVAVTAAAVVLAGCGAETTPDPAGTVPGRPTTTGPSSTAPSGSEPATTAPSGQTARVTVYFVQAEKAVPVTRTVPNVPRIGAEAVKALLAGPTADEKRVGMSTAIPASTQFRDLTIDNGVARVDLSRTFESGGGTLAITLRLAQVVCTLDEFPTVNGVRFAFDGQLVDVISGQGIAVDKPVTCETYAAYVGRPGTFFAGIWPFASAAELASYAGSSDQAFRDPSNTAKQFAEKYLGFGVAAVFPFRSTGTGTGEVPVGFGRGEGGPIANPQVTTVVQVRQLGETGAGKPWTVVGATSPDIEVDTPKAGDKATSPVRVTGRARTFEGNVVVEVREDGMVYRQSLGKGNVTGRGDGVLGPFEGRISFSAPTKPAGAVVFYEPSAADGSTLRAAVVRVSFT